VDRSKELYSLFLYLNGVQKELAAIKEVHVQEAKLINKGGTLLIA
jgi:hypothetical protein